MAWCSSRPSGGVRLITDVTQSTPLRETPASGIEFVADQAGAYWLLDIIIATEIAGTVINDGEYFGVVTLAVGSKKAILSVFDDMPGRKLYSRAIEYTDFPEGLWKFFLVYDGEHCVLMVPSEY